MQARQQAEDAIGVTNTKLTEAAAKLEEVGMSNWFNFGIIVARLWIEVVYDPSDMQVCRFVTVFTGQASWVCAECRRDRGAHQGAGNHSSEARG